MTFGPKRLVCLLGLILSTPVHAQEQPLVPVPFDGTEAFGHILHGFDLKPVARLEGASQLAPEKMLLIVFGDLRILGVVESKLGSLDTFRARGGAILLASDHAADLTEYLGLVIKGQKVFAHEGSAYKGTWEPCPVVTSWSEHPLFKDLRMGLATNRPGYIRPTTPTLSLLAEFSDDCSFLPASLGYLPLPKGSGYIFGSPRNAPPQGRTLILAGPGVFLNGMVVQPDNDNLAFTWNALRWLTAGPSGRREHALFIDEGNIVENFALPLHKVGSIPIPPIQVINRMIRGLEDENIFNRLLLDNVTKERVLRGLLLAASVALVVMGAWRFMHSGFRPDTKVPLLVSKDGPPPPALPVAWQRQEELRRTGNLWEPAQVLVRQFFLDHAGLTVPLWDDEAATPPAVVTGAGFWERRSLTRQLRRLWHLARSAPVRAVTPRQFDALLQTLASLTAALTDGRLKLVGNAERKFADS